MQKEQGKGFKMGCFIYQFGLFNKIKQFIQNGNFEFKNSFHSFVY